MKIPINEKHKMLRPKLSPNGRWMAYVSAESGRNEIYICSFPEMNKDRWQVTADGGDDPRWSQDGRRLFYRKGNTVIATQMKTEQASSMEKAEIPSLRRILAALFNAPKSRPGIAALLLYILCTAFVVMVVFCIMSAFSNTPSGHPSPSYIAIIFVLVLPIYGVAAILFGIAGTFVLKRSRGGALLAIFLTILDVIRGFLWLTRAQPNTFMQIVLVSWMAIDCLALVMIALSWNDLDRPSTRQTTD
jgi:hypothetical protein